MDRLRKRGSMPSDREKNSKKGKHDQTVSPTTVAGNLTNTPPGFDRLDSMEPVPNIINEISFVSTEQPQHPRVIHQAEVNKVQKNDGVGSDDDDDDDDDELCKLLDNVKIKDIKNIKHADSQKEEERPRSVNPMGVRFQKNCAPPPIRKPFYIAEI